MDEALNMRMKMSTNLSKSALLFLLAVSALQARAQALQDPTRPPAAAMASSAAPAAASSGPRLQSILVGREAGGRHLAVIDGETVRLGEQFHGARVTRIGDNEVELVRGSERQVLRLYALEASGITPVHGRNHGQESARTQARR
jgi:MSHA biogenesis protein MshK